MSLSLSFMKKRMGINRIFISGFIQSLVDYFVVVIVVVA